MNKRNDEVGFVFGHLNLMELVVKPAFYDVGFFNFNEYNISRLLARRFFGDEKNYLDDNPDSDYRN